MGDLLLGLVIGFVLGIVAFWKVNDSFPGLISNFRKGFEKKESEIVEVKKNG